jgi:hypothetical protein
MPSAGKVGTIASSPYYHCPTKSPKAASFSLYLNTKSTEAVPHMAYERNFTNVGKKDISRL